MSSKLLCAALFVSALLGTARGAAQSALLESYDVPAACPDAAWFEGEVRRRLSTTAPAPGALRVRVRFVDDQYRGTIERVGAGAELGARELAHPSCEQVSRALALVGALWLAPETDPQPGAAHVAPPAAMAQARPSSPPPSPHAPPKTRKSRESRWFHGPSFGIAARAQVAPEVRFGPQLRYRLVREHARSETELALSWTRLQSGTLWIEPAAHAELRYDAGALRGCETLALVASLRLGPCLALDLGALRGTGTVSGVAVTRAALWVSSEATVKLEWRPASLLFAELAAGGFYPLTRPAFHFAVSETDPSQRPIYNVPAALGFSGALTLGLRFR